MSSPISARCADEAHAGRRPNLTGPFFLALALATLWALAPAALAQGQADTPPDPAMLSVENYRVGADVYVRSLAVDQRRNTLWVGTSVGALEIDLESRDVRRTFTREDGLANEYVFAIGLDPRGHVWFGTNAGGTSTFNEGQWQTYFPMHGLADYWVYAFAFDKRGRNWIGTWDGVSLFDPESESFTTYHDELINIWVYGVAIDEEERVWFGTEGGVSMFDGRNWQSWTHDDGLGAPNLRGLPSSPNTGLGTRSREDLAVTVGNAESYNPNYVFAAHTDRQGRGIWFGTWGGGVSLFDGEDSWTTYTVADGLAGNIVYSIAQQADGALWFGTNRGLSRFDGKKWTTVRHGLAGQHVYAIALAGDSSVWIGTKGAVARIWQEE
jgi:ligand-binding sensor domain-containing protein